MPQITYTITGSIELADNNPATIAAGYTQIDTAFREAQLPGERRLDTKLVTRRKAAEAAEA